MKSFLHKRNELILSIGEDGLTAVYVVLGVVYKRIFCKTVQEEDVVELLEILQKDKTIKLNIYLDHQFQEYNQGNIPGVNILSANQIAQKKANANSKGDSYQISHEIYRTPTGRRDWVYLFVDFDFQGKVNMWLDFLRQYNNYISGIYALPLESYELIKKIKYYKKSKNKHHSNFSFLKRENKLRWDLLITSNKSGGLRIIGFFNQNPVFSRLITQFSKAENFDAEAEIVMQEITNSLEYLRRLNYSVHSIAESRIYMVLSQQVKARCDVSTLETKNVEIYSPYDLLSMLRLPRNLVKEKDRFCDPILIYIANQKKLKYTNIIPKNEARRHKLNKATIAIATALKYSIPVFFTVALFLGFNAINYLLQYNILSTDINDLEGLLTKQIASQQEQEKQFSDGLQSKHINEIVKIYNDLDAHKIPVLQLISEYAKINESFVRIKRMRWRVDSTRLKDQIKKDKAGKLRPRKNVDSLRYFMDATLIFFLQGSNYDQAFERYESYVEHVIDFFECCIVRFKMTDKEFTFQEIGKPIEVRLFVEYEDNSAQSFPAPRTGGTSTTSMPTSVDINTLPGGSSAREK